MRLNQKNRRQILVSVLEHKYKSKVKNLEIKSAKISKKVYESFFDKDKEKIFSKMPEEWKCKTNGLHVILTNGFNSFVDFSGKVKVKFVTVGRSNWNSTYHNLSKVEQVWWEVPKGFDTFNSKRFKISEELSEELLKLEQEVDTLNEEVRAAANKLKATLESMTSVKMLLQAWPEMKPFTDELVVVTKSKATVPAIARSELNTLFGLPV